MQRVLLRLSRLTCQSAVFHLLVIDFAFPSMLVSCKSRCLLQLQSFPAFARERTVVATLSDTVGALQVSFSPDPGKSTCHVSVALMYRGFGSRCALKSCLQGGQTHAL